MDQNAAENNLPDNTDDTEYPAVPAGGIILNDRPPIQCNRLPSILLLLASSFLSWIPLYLYNDQVKEDSISNDILHNKSYCITYYASNYLALLIAVFSFCCKKKSLTDYTSVHIFSRLVSVFQVVTNSLIMMQFEKLSSTAQTYGAVASTMTMFSAMYSAGETLVKYLNNRRQQQLLDAI